MKTIYSNLPAANKQVYHLVGKAVSVRLGLLSSWSDSKVKVCQHIDATS